MARLTRFFTRYYVLNLLVAASYFVVRTFYPYADVRKTSEFLGITRVRICLLRPAEATGGLTFVHGLRPGARDRADRLCRLGPAIHEDHDVGRVHGVDCVVRENDCRGRDVLC